MKVYRNLTSRPQVINTNAGRSLHVPPRGEVELQAGEEESPQIQGLTRRTRNQPQQGTISAK